MATIKIKQRWERIESALETASIVGGLLVAAGLWLEGWKGLGAKLVIVGVVIETFVSGWVLLASRKLQTIQERELEEMRLETAKANARAAEATLELARIEERFAPRKLNGEAAKRVERKLSVHSVRVAIVEARMEDSEAKDLLADLRNVFNKAYWEPVVTADPRRISRGLVGLLVIVNESAADADPDIMSAAESLVGALSAENILTQGPITTPSGSGRIFDGSAGPPILLVIGAKPDFKVKH